MKCAPFSILGSSKDISAGSLLWDGFPFGRPADTQNHADINTVDDRGGPTFTDERQRLSGHRGETYGHKHVEQGLYDKHDSQSHGKECREVIFAAIGYFSRSEQEDDVEHSHEEGSFDAHFFDDDGIDEVGEGL